MKLNCKVCGIVSDKSMTISLSDILPSGGHSIDVCLCEECFKEVEEISSLKSFMAIKLLTIERKLDRLLAKGKNPLPRY